MLRPSQKESEKTNLIFVMATIPVWYQRVISISAKKRGCHLIQKEVENAMPEIKTLKHGLLHILSKTVKTQNTRFFLYNFHFQLLEV